MEKFEKARMLTVKGEIETAIDYCINDFSFSGKSLKDNFRSLKAEFLELEHQIDLGIIRDSNIEKRRITYSLLSHISKQEKLENPSLRNEAKTKIEDALVHFYKETNNKNIEKEDHKKIVKKIKKLEKQYKKLQKTGMFLNISLIINNALQIGVFSSNLMSLDDSSEDLEFEEYDDY